VLYLIHASLTGAIIGTPGPRRAGTNQLGITSGPCVQHVGEIIVVFT